MTFDIFPLPLVKPDVNIWQHRSWVFLIFLTALLPKYYRVEQALICSTDL